MNEAKKICLVILESPLRPKTSRKNRAYALACLRDSLTRGEAPFASHLLYTLVLDDDVEAEREEGIEAGLAWGVVADLTAVYCDLGISDGMRQGIERAKLEERTVVMRTIEGWCWPPKGEK